MVASSLVMATTERTYKERKKTGLNYFFGLILSLIGWFFFTVFISIMIEFVIITFFSDEGSIRSERMLKQELSYLDRDFKQSVYGSEPAKIARDFAKFTYQWMIIESGFLSLVNWSKEPRQTNEDKNSLRLIVGEIYRISGEYFLSAINIIELMSVRLAIALLSFPAFFLIGLVAFVDGLVVRDLRRFGVAIEQSYLFHHSKVWIGKLIIIAWVVYLAVPWAIHPNMIFIPASLLFGLAIWLSASTFKKYL